jgi:CheY-like chemotaxis protein
VSHPVSAADPRPTVLIVDDDRTLSLLASRAIDKLGGCRAVVASSGAEGLELAARERPALVLLDLWMGDMDGPAVLEALRGTPETATIRVVMLSGEEDGAILDRCLALGAMEVLRKPIDARALAARVRDLVMPTAGAGDTDG